VAHVGIVEGGVPFVIPMGYARDGERILLHGSSKSRLLGTLRDGAEVAVTVTLLDALVFARSAFHHSMNYRSVVVLGKAEPVEEPEAKLRALDVLLEKLVPGRLGETRPPNPTELKATLVVSVPLEAHVSTERQARDAPAGSMPVRTGPDLGAEAKRENLRPDPADSSDNIMTVFMHCGHNAECDQECADRIQDVAEIRYQVEHMGSCHCRFALQVTPATRPHWSRSSG